MADNFVSYSRHDKARITALVKALEGEGFSVFWDPDIMPGHEWAEVLERELLSAKAVIVAWTDNSRASRWVREEADLAFEHRKLIPLTLDPSGPPFGFRTIQAADFIGWSGDKSAECWQRLTIMLQGVMEANERDAARDAARIRRAAPHPTQPGSKPIAEAPEASARSAPTPEPRSSDATKDQSATPPAKPQPQSTPRARRLRPPARPFPWIDVFALGAAGLALYAASRFELGALGVGVIAAATVFVLFQAADRQMPPAYHALARRWLMPVKDGLRINVAEAFQSMFQAVFWHRHLSARCLWRSAVASTLAFGALFAFAWLFIDPFQAAFRAEWGPFLRDLTITFMIANIAADYLSLFQTRLFIRFLARHPWTAPVVVIVDFIATLAILAFVLYAVNAASQWASFTFGLGASGAEGRLAGTGLGEAGELAGRAQEAAEARAFRWPSFLGFYQSLIPQLTNPEAGVADLWARSWLLILSACTTYITSIWLLFILVFGSALRALVGRDGAPTWLGRVLAARERPFTAFGAVSAALTLVAAVPVYALTARAVSEAQPGPGPDAPASGEGGEVARAIAGAERGAAVSEREFRDCSDCPVMVVVPAGSFTMGSPAGEAGREANEGPQRPVTIPRAFAVGKFEVTWDEWDACVRGGGCSNSGPDGAGGDEGWGKGSRPVINVSWKDAQAYVGWLSGKTGEDYRLLSEAEWEYAARAGTTTPYFTGTSITTAQANFNGDTYLGQTVPVGGYAANSFGLHDMHGNVWEWVEDCYRDSYETAPTDGSAVRGDRPGTDECSSLRVLRGGSWDSLPQVLRSADRYWYDPTNRIYSIGFRLARTVSP